MKYESIFYLVNDNGAERAWEVIESEKVAVIRASNRQHFFKACMELKKEINFPLNKEWTE